MVTVMVMNDLLPPPLCNVNRRSHSEIQQFQNLIMKIHGQGHVWSKVKVTLDLQHSKVKVMVKVKPIGHIWSLEFNRYVCFSFRGNRTIFWLRYSKFHIWPWKFKVKVMMKIDQNLVRQSIGHGQQSCQKWKKSNKLFKSYRVNKNLQPGANEAVQKHKVTPGIPEWLNNQSCHAKFSGRSGRLIEHRLLRFKDSKRVYLIQCSAVITQSI